MEHDLRPFTDDLPGDVVPLDQAHPRNPKEGYSRQQLFWLGASILPPWDPDFPIALAFLVGPHAMIAALLLCVFSGRLMHCFAVAVVATGVLAGVAVLGIWAYSIVRPRLAKQLVVPWTGTLGRFRVQRGAERLILIDPLWPRRWGATYSTLKLPFVSKSLKSLEFPDPETSASPRSRPGSYRINAAQRTRPAVESAGMDAERVSSKFLIRKGCLQTIKHRNVGLALERIIALEVAGGNATLWFRDGHGRLSKLRVWRHGIAFAQALLAEPAFFACAPLRFNDSDARNFDWIQQYKPEPAVAT